MRQRISAEGLPTTCRPFPSGPGALPPRRHHTYLRAYEKEKFVGMNARALARARTPRGNFRELELGWHLGSWDPLQGKGRFCCAARASMVGGEVTSGEIEKGAAAWVKLQRPRPPNETWPVISEQGCPVFVFVDATQPTKTFCALAERAEPFHNATYYRRHPAGWMYFGTQYGVFTPRFTSTAIVSGNGFHLTNQQVKFWSWEIDGGVWVRYLCLLYPGHRVAAPFVRSVCLHPRNSKLSNRMEAERVVANNAAWEISVGAVLRWRTASSRSTEPKHRCASLLGS